MRTSYLLLLATLVLLGCSSGGVNRFEKNTTITVEYAVVQDIEEIELDSEVGESAAMGGLWGLASASAGDRYDMIGGAVAGAVLMGLTTRIAEGSSKATAYTVKAVSDNAIFKVIMDNIDVRIGDCVALETGHTTNLRYVSRSLCFS